MDMRFADDQFCGAVQHRGFPSLPFTRAKMPREKKMRKKNTTKEKQEESEGEKKEGEKEREESGSRVSALRRGYGGEGMLLLCREAFAPTEGGRRREAGCNDMTGGVEEPDAKRDRERTGPRKVGRRRRIRNKGEGKGRKENRWNEIKGEGRRRGWRRAGRSAGGEVKSMHRGGMQRARCARQYGALRQRVHIPPHFIPTAKRSLSLLLVGALL